MNTKQAVKRLKNKFEFHRPHNGQLVVTAEIMRVTDNRWGTKNGCNYREIEVKDLSPRGGKHIVKFGTMGQQCVMILKTNSRRRRKNK